MIERLDERPLEAALAAYGDGFEDPRSTHTEALRAACEAYVAAVRAAVAHQQMLDDMVRCGECGQRKKAA